MNAVAVLHHRLLSSHADDIRHRTSTYAQDSDEYTEHQNIVIVGLLRRRTLAHSTGQSSHFDVLHLMGSFI